MLAAPGAQGAAIIPAVAILVVACPCALGLATPTAIIVGMGKGASRGVIFKSGDAIEMLSEVKDAIFDKTGTLTDCRPSVRDVVQVKQTVSKDGAVRQDEQGVLALAAIAENYSEHPLAKAIMEHAKGAGIEPGDISDFAATPGRGVTAVMGSTTIRVGTAEFFESAGVMVGHAIAEAEKLQQEGKTAVMWPQTKKQ